METPDDWMSGMPVVRLARLGLNAQQIRMVLRFRAKHHAEESPRPNPMPGIPYVESGTISTSRKEYDRLRVARRRKESALELIRERKGL